jgi:beta-glucosidase
LRGEWKFPGFVVSDWESVAEMINHGVVAGSTNAARLALTAGVDMEMVSTTYRDTLAQQVNTGKIPLAVVDEAVRRVLLVKFAKGLFERPYVDESLYADAFLRPDALALAREAAAKSCVLLKNEDNALPLSRNLKHIALIGPLADAGGEMLGCWSFSGHGEDGVSLATGIRAQLSPDAQVTVVRGCDLTSTAKISKRLDGTVIASEADTKTEDDGIAKAVAAANAAEVVILALGEPAGWTGENSSRSELNLPGRQQELFDAVAATGKPVIVVLFNGRPLAIPQVAAKAAAILEAWHPGVQAGPGVADILFGTVEPGGRLTTTFPRSVGQVPLYYNHSNTGRPDAKHGGYVDGPRDPLYPFGFGLAYTTFEFGETKISTATLPVDGNFIVQAQIKNTGVRAGLAVAELYVRALTASAGARPVRELKGFQKILLQHGETRVVSFSLSPKELGYFDAKGNWLVEPGKMQLWIAPDSASGTPADFAIVDKNNPGHAGEKIAESSINGH